MKPVTYFHDGEGNATYLRADLDANQGQVDQFTLYGQAILFQGSAEAAADYYVDRDAVDFMTPSMAARFEVFAGELGVTPPSEPEEPEEDPEPDPEDEE